MIAIYRWEARRGDGNDLTPSPKKLVTIGVELNKLNKVSRIYIYIYLFIYLFYFIYFLLYEDLLLTL